MFHKCLALLPHASFQHPMKRFNGYLLILLSNETPVQDCPNRESIFISVLYYIIIIYIIILYHQESKPFEEMLMYIKSMFKHLLSKQNSNIYSSLDKRIEYFNFQSYTNALEKTGKKSCIFFFLSS